MGEIWAMFLGLLCAGFAGAVLVHHQRWIGQQRYPRWLSEDEKAAIVAEERDVLRELDKIYQIDHTPLRGETWP